MAPSPTLAERPKLFAMPTSKSHLAVIMALVLGIWIPGAAVHAADPHSGDKARFASSQVALEKGLADFKRGAYTEALPALEFAAANGEFTAQFALAQIYADNNGANTDHAKAYMLYQGIADEYSDADPDDDRRAPYVAKSLTALAGYLQVGIREIGLKPDPERAADYLHHAALFFGDEDAQFELVKLKLAGDGVPEDIAGAKHWLAVLSQRGHAGAQAFLADLYWRGKFVEADKVRAFALISVAVEHAPPRERIWIEDVYQNIFCGAGEGIRRQATGMVADWRARYGRKQAEPQTADLDPLAAPADRTCRNGDRVVPYTPAGRMDALVPTEPNGKVADMPKVAGGSASQQAITQAVPATDSSALGGFRDAGSKTLEPLPVPGFAQGFAPDASSAGRTH